MEHSQLMRMKNILEAFENLIKGKNLSEEKTQKLIENYLYAEREPIQDDILDLIEGDKPSVLQRKKWVIEY